MKKLLDFEVVYSYVFVKKSNFVFSYSSMLYFDSLKGFRFYTYRGYQVAKYIFH